MNTETIAARRQHIQDSAKCVGCGATLAECKAARGKDPTAPAWFGSCACGLDFRPCRHKADARALLALVAEIESGTVRTVEEATPKPRAAKTGMTWFDYLNQGEQWQPKGKPMVAIADMDSEWRYNAARLLEKRAPVIGARYALDQTIWFAAQMASPLGPSETSADGIQRDIEREDAEIKRDPVAWTRTKKLHRVLVAGLHDCSAALTALAERAKHWSTCPARTGGDDCRCEQLRLVAKHWATCSGPVSGSECHCKQLSTEAEHLTECALRNGWPEAGCTCRDNSPEWTDD